jgi:hypothetical protein
MFHVEHTEAVGSHRCGLLNSPATQLSAEPRACDRSTWNILPLPLTVLGGIAI